MTELLPAFFEQFHAAFERAASRQSSRLKSRIRAGGVTFQLCFATACMQDALLPALRHLVVPANDAAGDDFSVSIWESATTGVQPPPPPQPLINPAT